jgi:fermentation-respiration switch protein FrsA (DUF1100 family)
MSDAPSDDRIQQDASGSAKPTKSRRWLWIRLIGYPAIAYLVLLGTMMGLEESFIFAPSVYPEGYWTPLTFKPEDAWFSSPDGVRLHGWYVGHERPRAVVLFAHGNAGNVSHRAEILELFVHRLQVSALALDYRGYGRSEGKPTEKGILADARAARQWLANRSGVAEGDIVLMGESLGGGVVVDLAAKEGARGLILENTFSSLPEVAAFHFPWVPVKWFMRTQLNSVKEIVRYRGPLLQIHGDADSIIPLDLAQRLHAAANPPKDLVIIHGGDHNDPRTPEFIQALDDFIARLPPLGQAP